MKAIQHSAKACWPKKVPWDTSRKIPMIHALPTLHTRGLYIAQKIISIAIQLGRIAFKLSFKGNIVNIEMLKREKEYLTFSFDLQIKDLKNFTNLISQIKQSNLRFKIIRHKQKKNAFIRRIFENFKRN